MHKIFGLIATLLAILGFILLVVVFWTHVRTTGSTLGFANWGVYLSIGAALFGVIAYVVRDKFEPVSRTAELGLGLGLGNLLATLIAVIFFG